MSLPGHRTSDVVHIASRVKLWSHACVRDARSAVQAVVPGKDGVGFPVREGQASGRKSERENRVRRLVCGCG